MKKMLLYLKEVGHDCTPGFDAEKHTRSSHARWPAPGSGAAPPAEHVTVMTETDGNTHT